MKITKEMEGKLVRKYGWTDPGKVIHVDGNFVWIRTGDEDQSLGEIYRADIDNWNLVEEPPKPQKPSERIEEIISGNRIYGNIKGPHHKYDLISATIQYLDEEWEKRK